MKQCGLEKVNQLSQGHMIRDHMTDGTRHQIWRQKEFAVSLPTRAWTCPISKSLETDKSLLKEKTEVLETSLATHPHFCLNRIFRGPTGEGSAPLRAMPCGKTMSLGASLSQGSIRPLLYSAEKSPAPKHLSQVSLPSGCSSPRWFSARHLVTGGLGPNDTLFAARGCLHSLKHRAASREIPGLKRWSGVPTTGPS